MKKNLPLFSIVGLLFILLAGEINAQISFQTESFQMTVDKAGAVTGLIDKATGVNYVPDGAAGVIMGIKKGEAILLPRQCKRKNNVLYLTFPDKSKAELMVAEKAHYLTFELMKVEPEQAVDAVIWGPFTTTIGDTIGEIVGVVRNGNFAIGLQALNPKTTGGVLTNDEGVVYERGSAAISQDYGSSLQAYCINRNKSRHIKGWNQYENMPMPAIEEAGLPGSKMALFGVKTRDALTTIGNIEVAEGLPHPEIDGTWIKESPETGRAYLIASFTEDNVDEMLDYTKRMGLLSLYHEHPFKNWGHFDLIEEQFPNGRAGMKQCVEKGKALGIRVGVHTLTSFITTSDPFISPVPHHGLAVSGGSVLARAISATDDEIQVESPDYFKHKSNLQSVQIGDELIRYQSVTFEQPYMLTGCIRGAFHTKASNHASGAAVNKLVDHAYKVFFPGWELQKELIRNMADFFNETGVSHMDFDGHEGTYATGMGDYSMDYFAEQFLNQVDHLVVNGSSRSNHYYWHMNHYLNWGEPWYGGFRESMSDYRFNNQPLLERNYMPNMLGWFLMTPASTVEDIEWMMARAAGYNAGYALVARYRSLKENPHTDAIIQQIRLWEEAKRNGVFSPEQRQRLKDPDNEFHLGRDDQQWYLQNFTKFTFTHENKLLQPGQPTYSEWFFTNRNEAQPLNLQLLVTGEQGEIRNMKIEVDNYFEMTIDETLPKGYSLVWNGGSTVKIYDNKGRLKKEVETGKSLADLKTGPHAMIFDCTFSEDANVAVKTTVKLKGEVETIQR